MYQIDPKKPFYSTLTTMLIFGHIPKNMNSGTLGLFIFYHNFIMSLYLTCNCLAPFLHLVMSVRDNSGVDISEDLAISYNSLSAWLLNILFTVRWKKWSQLLNDLVEDTEFGRDPDFDKVSKRLNRISAMYSIYCLSMGLIYALIKFLLSGQCQQMNEEMGLHEICGTFIRIWLPFDHVSKIVTITVFSLQVILFLFLIAPSGCICFIAWEATEVLMSHNNNLKRHFVAVFDEPCRVKRVEKLSFCVRYHNHILDLAQRLSADVKYSCSVVSIMGVLAFTFLANQLLKDQALTAILYSISYLVGLFCICHAGQRIIDETSSVNDAVYESKWYNADLDQMKDVCFILARSQKASCLGTLPFGYLDYPLFLLVFKTSYSYLTLLSQTM